MSKYSSVKTDEMVGIFKALSNEHRLKIYNILTRCCTPGTSCSSNEAFGFCVGELDSQLDIAASTLSHHLKELHHAGLINMKRDGKQIHCSVNTDTLKLLQNLFDSNTINQ